MSISRACTWFGCFGLLFLNLSCGKGQHRELLRKADPTFDSTQVFKGRIRGEVLLRTDSPRTWSEVEKDLKENGFHSARVSPFIDDVELPEGECEDLSGSTFRVQLNSAQALPDVGISYVESIEPHFVFRSEALLGSRQSQYNKVKAAVRSENWEEVLEHSAEYFRLYAWESDRQTYLAYEDRFEALYQLAQYERLVDETRVLLRRETTRSDWIEPVYEKQLEGLGALGRLDELKALKDFLIADRSTRATPLARRIKKERAEEEERQREMEALEEARADLDRLVAEGKWLEAGVLAYEDLEDPTQALLLFGDRWVSFDAESDRRLFRRVVQLLVLIHRNDEDLLRGVFLAIFSNELDAHLNRRTTNRYLADAYEIEKESSGPELLFYEELMLERLPEHHESLEIQRKRAEALAEIERRREIRDRSIRELSDPMNEFLWGFHSKIDVVRTRPRGSEYEITERDSSADRFDIRLPEAFSEVLSSGGFQEVKVAVLDSGIDFEHPDLDQVIAYNEGEMGEWAEAPAGSDCQTLDCNGIDDDQNGWVDDWRGYDFIDDDPDPRDDNGHGTHVSGIIAAEFDGEGLSGINPEAKILPVKVLDQDGSGSTQQIANGLIYAVKQGAKIVNVSLGGSARSRIIGELYSCLSRNGISIFAAAGNGSHREAHYPSDYEGVVSVGAVTSTGARASFSNHSLSVDLFAPGLGILSTWPTRRVPVEENIFSSEAGAYASLNGTSMATPFATGVASLLKSWRPDMPRTELLGRLFVSAEKSERDDLGAIDAFAALRATPRTILRPSKSSRRLTHAYSTNQPTGATIPLRLEFDSIWEPLSRLPMVTVQSGGNELEVELQDIQRTDQGLEVDLEVSRRGGVPEVKEVPIEIQFDRSQTSQVEVRLEPFFRYFNQLTPGNQPSTSFWLPSFWGWGLWTVADPTEGSIWTASSVLAYKGSASRKIRISKMDINGNDRPGWPRTFQIIANEPDFVSRPKDIDGDGHLELVLAANGSDRLDRENGPESGLNIIELGGDSEGTVSRKLDLEGRMVALAAGEDGVIRSIQEVWSEDDRKLNRYTQHDSELNELLSEDYPLFFQEPPLLKVCDFNSDSSQEALLVMDRGSQAHPNFDTVVRIFRREGLVAEMVLENLNTESVACEGNKIFLNSRRDDERIHLELNAYSVDLEKEGSEVFQSLWSKRHDGYDGGANILPIAWGEDQIQTAVFFNDKYHRFTGVNAETGEELEGFPADSPPDRKESYFLMRAKKVGSTLVVTEPLDRVHFYDLRGRHLRSMKLSGHFWGSPLLLPTREGEHLFLTGHRGVHKIPLNLSSRF